MRFIRFLVLTIGVFIATILVAYDYPMKPFNKQHKVIATLGESRGTRFHTGVDIMPKTTVPTDSFWLVYSLRSDTILRYNYPTDTFTNGVFDNDSIYCYLHLTNRVAESTFVTAFVDTIGRIFASKAHCHLIEREATTLQYLNPLRSAGLSPFLDTVPPIIESVSFKRQGSGAHLDKNNLNDSVDIVVRVYDPRVDTTGGNAGRGMGIYKIQYQILDTLKNPIAGAINSYQFDSLPLNSATARYALVYHDSTDWENGIFYYWVSNAPFLDTANQYWNTKQHINRQWYEPPAESIEVAKFKDGYFYVKIKAWDICRPITNPCDSETIRVHVDNFNPRVKHTYPDNWYRWIARDEKEVWCVFSEAMDTATLNTTNIKIRSLVDTIYYYSITNITYVDSLHKLILEVDSFRFHDEVQVWLSDSIKDLAGKSLEPSGSKSPASYTWKFTVGVIKITDNDLMDIRPDIYGDNIAWVEVLSSTQSNLKLHNITSHNTVRLNTTTDGFHNWPIVWKDRVAWREEAISGDRIWYWDGNSIQLIVSEGLFRNQYDFDSCGIVMYSTIRWDGGYPDTIWVQYYQIGAGLLLLDKYTVKDGFSRNVDIDGSMIVWEHGKTASLKGDFNLNGFRNNSISLWFERGFKNARKNIGFLGDSRAVYTKDIYLRGDFGVWNLTSFMDSSINAMPSVSQGQSAWMRYTWNKDTLTIAVWVYDGVGGRQLSVLPYINYGIYWPEIQNGDVMWHDYYSGTGLQRLHYYDGWQDNILVSGYSTTDFVVWNWRVENTQAVWLQLGAVYYPVYYDGQQIKKLLERSSDSYRISMHQGLVVYDAWDGHDNEIYLYIGDTLKTPPAIVKNLQGEVLGGKLPAKKVRLTWKQNTDHDLVGYKIYRSATSYQYGTTPYATILAPETTFIDTLPLEGMNYYVATAYDNLNNEGGFSNQVSVFIDNIPPAVPTNLVASYDSIAQKVSLLWRSSPDGDLKLYKVYRSETSGSYTLPLDLVFKPDTTFVDSVFYLGKTYYYVVSAVDTNKNESGFSNEDTVIVPFFVASDFALATAYNSGHKIISDNEGKKIDFVYANEGWLTQAGIYYSYSSDSGKSFSASALVGGPGMYPALAIDTAGNPCASWVDGSNIYYTYWTASWAPPDTIVIPVVNVSPPSMVVDTTDTVHIVFTQYYWLPSDTGDLIYLKFHREYFDEAISETLLTNTFCRTPSLTLDLSKNLHIIWESEKCICYQEKDSTGWLGVDTIYTTGTNERLYPVIDLYGTNIHTVWQNRDSLGNLDIYSRMKTDVGWDSVKKVASTVGESKFPTLAGAHYCLWQDNSSGNWEIYLSKFVDTAGIWTTPVNISNTSTASVFPHSAYALVDTASAKLYCLWTEGDTIPYSIKFQRLGVDPVAKIFVDLGQPVQSPYTLERDGYWKFGTKPYETTDWGYEDLRYRFTGLDQEKEYRLDLAYYFRNEAIKGNLGQLEAIEEKKSQNPNPKSQTNSNIQIINNEQNEMPKQVRHDNAGVVQNDTDEKPIDEKGIGRIIQAMVVDGTPLDTIFITPNKLVRKSIWLKKESYANGEIILEFNKVKGKRVICSEIGLYEFPCEIEREVAGGIMGEEGLISKTFSFERIFPNPTKGLLRIRFNSPDERPITIKLYDVLGRLVDKQKLKKAKIGNNEVLLVPKDLSSGVYFMNLEADNYQKIEKVIYLK